MGMLTHLGFFGKSQAAMAQSCSPGGGILVVSSYQKWHFRCLMESMLIWCVCAYRISTLALLLNTPLVASDLVLLASLAIPRNQPGTDSCTRLSDLQCRFYPQDQVALLQRTPTISRKRLKLYSRSPPFFFF